MFFFGMIQNGPRGIHAAADEEEEIDDIESYGIDWEDYDNDNILHHHRQANHTDNPDDNPFMTNRPETMTQVNVDAPGCPLTEEQISFLDLELGSLPYIHSHSMDSYRLFWISALHICVHIFSG
jgi:hypothetical protein